MNSNDNLTKGKKRKHEKTSDSSKTKKVIVETPIMERPSESTQQLNQQAEIKNALRRSLESKNLPKHLNICMSCFEYIHDVPGETSVFVFEHMCDSKMKRFDLLRKFKEIMNAIPDSEQVNLEKSLKPEQTGELNGPILPPTLPPPPPPPPQPMPLAPKAIDAGMNKILKNKKKEVTPVEKKKKNDFDQELKNAIASWPVKGKQKAERTLPKHDEEVARKTGP